MQHKSLRLFLSVAETGSFVAAAERLNTVQSNVTAHIKKLEQELGTQLIDRNGRARLTSSGFTLARYARQILRSHDEALALFHGREPPRGQLRLGAMETTMALRLPSILADFHAHHAEVDIQLQTGPTAELVSDLLEGKLDAAFVAGPVEHERLHGVKAFSERLILVAAQPMERLPSTETLRSVPFLAFRQGCSYRQRIELLLASCGVSAGRVFEFGSLDAILGCVAAGMGYALLPQATVDAHRHRFDIHSLALPTPLANVDTFLATLSSPTWSPALARFVEVLCQATGSPDSTDEISM
ncbi:LysR family transcriptional regulator [Modicisalibacter radicis]|uniref:LysR family transcriptional regulator n=1 Tax=Halomonas sp. EAR18 TaxID=2518972 RepID=UPI00109C6E24|nr:LysR family transcriptional regulator [Halomonas sp. EAR18]